ncbi:MAG: endonuclease/exonuclease/phosphatase family protein [Candidatus Doudnabacteria bacterium]|nr:endonuclease/exonuclease/phosphatase family protein [Candidatus Doudnabacteria bacterium]
MNIKYLNLNIWMGNLLKPALEFLKEQDADIVSLQEVLDTEYLNAPARFRLKETLLKELGYKYYAYFPLVKEMTLEYPAFFGNMVLSKFPIQASKEIWFDRSFVEWNKNGGYEEFPRGMLQVSIQLPSNKILQIFNVHGIWGTHGRDTERRLEMVRTILNNLPPENELTVLSGDFNLNENIYPEVGGKPDLKKPQRTKSVALLEERLVNVFRDERVTSFNMNYKDKATTYACAVVDLVFISPDLKLLLKNHSQKEVSDHTPQVVEIEI